MDVSGFPRNLGRQARLASMSPLDASRAFLRFAFGMGDEPAICFALRHDPRITLDDDAVLDVFMRLVDEAEGRNVRVEDLITPEAFLDRLAARSARTR